MNSIVFFLLIWDDKNSEFNTWILHKTDRSRVSGEILSNQLLDCWLTTLPISYASIPSSFFSRKHRFLLISDTSCKKFLAPTSLRKSNLLYSQHREMFWKPSPAVKPGSYPPETFIKIPHELKNTWHPAIILWIFYIIGIRMSGNLGRYEQKL